MAHTHLQGSTRRRAGVASNSNTITLSACRCRVAIGLAVVEAAGSHDGLRTLYLPKKKSEHRRVKMVRRVSRRTHAVPKVTSNQGVCNPKDEKDDSGNRQPAR